MQVIFLIALLILPAIFSSCTAIRGYPQRSDDIHNELKQLKIYYAADIINQYSGKQSESDKRMFRDEVILGRIRAIDLHFDIFRKSLTKEYVTLNLGSDLSVLGLNAAGVIVPTASTKAIFAAISGGLVGAKGTIDKDVFYEKTIAVLFSKMDALRKERLVMIRTGLGLNTDKYPILQAMIDVEDYFNAGTLPGAIMGIAVISGAMIQKADEDLKNLITIQYVASGPTRPLRDRINRWLDRDPRTNIPLLGKWLRAQKPPITLSPASWVESPTTTADDLLRAINDPALNIPE
jgi:hypothetical protein